jgi:hypothetical protein
MLSLKTDVSKKILKIKIIFVGILKVTDEKSMIRIRSWIRIPNQVYGFKDLDPDQNVTDSEPCIPYISNMPS